MSSGIKVSFDFRFDRDDTKHAELNTVRQSLIKRFGESYSGSDMEIERMVLYPVARAGKSGSEVFYLDIYLKDVSFPAHFIAKFQTLKETQSEFLSAKKARHAKLCTMIEKFEDDAKDTGLILYDLARVENHQEFRGFFLDESRNDNQCAQALSSIFKKVGSLLNKSLPAKNMLDDFDWYVNRKSQPLSRINALVEDGHTKLDLDSLAREINLHYEKIKNDIKFKAYPCLVHGDLHARNLMLNSENPEETELIDFGWVHYGHPAKDFVLMEVTLKYMLLSEFVGKIAKVKTSSPHLPLHLFKWFEDFLCSNGLCLPDVTLFKSELNKKDNILEHYKIALIRVYTSLKAVRTAALESLTNYCQSYDDLKATKPEQHYFVCQFLVILGLNGFSEMEPFWTLIGLKMVGDKIWTV